MKVRKAAQFGLGEALLRSELNGGEILQTAVGTIVVILLEPGIQDLLGVLDGQRVVLR
jgi:hypothetical protein